MTVQYLIYTYDAYYKFKPILEWFIHLSRGIFVLYFNFSSSITAGEPLVLKTYVAQFYGRPRFIRSVLRA